MAAGDWVDQGFERALEIARNPWFTLGHTTVSLWTLIALLVTLAITWYGSRTLERTILRAGGRRKAVNHATLYALARIVRYALITLGVIIGLNVVGIDLTALALFGGAIGIGIGLGLQTIFSNFVSGIILLLEQTLKQDDFVELESGVRGKVVEIGMRYTLVRTNSALDVIVPNSEFTNGKVTSWTHGSLYRRLKVPFGVAYGSDKEKVREAGFAAARSVPLTVEDDERRIDVWCSRFGDSALEFELIVWIGPDAIARPGSTLSRYLWALDDALARHGIEIPYSQRDLNISGRLGVDLARVCPESAVKSAES